MKRTLATGLATAALLSAGLSWAGLELAAGTAEAFPGPYTWCPGKGVSPHDQSIDVAWPPPNKDAIHWDWSVCHTFYIFTPTSNVGADTHIWEGNDPPPNLPPRPNGPVFCTPRGGLFIVGPICDEIGQ